VSYELRLKKEVSMDQITENQKIKFIIATDVINAWDSA
jgi:hypothetical protein